MWGCRHEKDESNETSSFDIQSLCEYFYFRWIQVISVADFLLWQLLESCRVIYFQIFSPLIEESWPTDFNLSWSQGSGCWRNLFISFSTTNVVITMSRARDSFLQKGSSESCTDDPAWLSILIMTWISEQLSMTEQSRHDRDRQRKMIVQCSVGKSVWRWTNVDVVCWFTAQCTPVVTFLLYSI